MGLTDRVDRIGPGVGQGDDFRARRLSLQQIGAEVRRANGMRDGADHRSARLDDRFARVALQGLAEGVVEADEEPGGSARLRDRAPERRA